MSNVHDNDRWSDPITFYPRAAKFEFLSRVNFSGPSLYCAQVDAVRIYTSYRLNLLLPKGQIRVYRT